MVCAIDGAPPASLAWWILFNPVLGSCVPLKPESRAGDGDPVLSPVAPLCGLGCGPVASRLRAAVCLVPPWEASPDPDRGSALACRAHRGRPQKGVEVFVGGYRQVIQTR